MKKYDKYNFFKHTYCEFEHKLLDELELEIHFKSKSGSSYFYTNEGVFRYSNHWGRVANCRWKIRGIEKYKHQKYYVGYAKWEDFFSLNSVDKIFYISIDFFKKEVQVNRFTEDVKIESPLNTIHVALKKKKEIQTVFKDVKWMQYFEVESNILQKQIIERIINTNKTLQEIKLELRQNNGVL